MKNKSITSRGIPVYIMICLFVIVLATSFTSAVWTADLNNDLRLYYEFEEGIGTTVEDKSPFGNNGTLSGGAGFVSGLVGTFASNYSGTAQQTSSDDNTSVTGAQQRTLNFWAAANVTDGTLVSMGLDAINKSLNVQARIGNWQVTIFSDPIDSGVAADTDKHMHTVVYNGSDIRYSLDGVNLVNATRHGIDTSNSNLTIGNNVWGGNPFTGVIDEVGLWSTVLNQTQIIQLYNGGNGIAFVLPSFTLTTTLISPTNNTKTINPLATFNASFAPTLLNLTNATLMVWYTNGTLFNETTNAISGSSTNSTTWNVNLPFDTLLWNVLGCIKNSTDSACSSATSNFTLIVEKFAIANQSFNNNPLETDSERFELNLTTTSSISSVIANLIYNATSFSSTVSCVSGICNIFRLLDIPIMTSGSSQNRSFFWELIMVESGSEVLSNTTANEQNVSSFNITRCGDAPYNVPFINFTFRNETVGQDFTTGFVSESFWTYWLGTGTTNKTLTYSNITELSSYEFCGTPAQETANIDVSLSYDNAVSQQRNFNPGTLSISNSTNNQTLWLLPTSDGIFVTFQVVNTAEQPIEGALVTITRSGFEGNIAQQLTGASGTVSIFLNPNFAYTLTVSKTGFSTFVATQTFPTSEFTVQLGTQTITSPDNFLTGITYQVEPRSRILENNTNQQFNFTINSTFWGLQEWGFVLKNSTGDTLGSATASTPTTGGQVNTTINTGNNTRIELQFFWRIEGNYMNGTVIYGVASQSSGSLKGFFDRLKIYLGQGIFGVNQFGIAIITFLIIFVTVGILSFKFGINSPEAIMMAALFIVALFDIGFGLIPTPFIGSLPGFPTFIVAVIVVAFWLGRNR